MAYYEIIRGDGEEVFCQSIELGDLGKFGNNTFNKKINLKGKTVEKLGLIGKEKAIACETIVSLNCYA